MAQLTLDEVTKTFQDDDGEIIAVDEVSVDIEDGEFLCVVGPSGCGKSTTLRMIAGLEDITRGEIRLDGQIINDQPPARRNVAMVFQSYALYPHMTVKENMSFGLEESTDMPDDEINERVEKTCRIWASASSSTANPANSPVGNNNASRSVALSSGTRKCS